MGNREQQRQQTRAQRLKGRVAIVTGAGRGIGRAIAQRFAAEGASVVIAEIDEANGQEAAEAIRAEGQNALCVACDVTDEAQVRAMVEEALAEFGRIDILVNNAIWGGDWINGDPWMAVEVALRGTWHCSRAALPSMVERRSGSIVNISSVQALMGFGTDHLYTAAKGAIVSLTRSMACEHGKHGIRINAICPGTVDTEQWDERKRADPQVLERVKRLYPLGRVGEPRDVADAAVFLASDEATFITGAVLAVDGGITAGYVAFEET